MRQMHLKEIFSDARGKIESIHSGIPFREMNRFTSEKGAVRGGHYHKESTELIYVVEGKVELEVRDVKTGKTSKVVLAKDDCLLIEPYEAHSARMLEDTVWINALTKEYDKSKPDIYN
ncbi:cupin domain-containing protein [Candidatus Woesearchaeota archaeon]|nr:cupin domain-containing protein [Candidatus Woesearchaeota archaeon]